MVKRKVEKGRKRKQTRKPKAIQTPQKRGQKAKTRKIFINGKEITSIIVTKIEIPSQVKETQYSVQVEMNSAKQKNIINSFTSCLINENK